MSYPVTVLVKVRASSKSSNIIYIITCRRCSTQYVGETGQQLHCRLNNHHYDITHQRTKDSPVAEHFNSLAHLEADRVVMVIHQLQNYKPCLCKIREGRWIRTLRTSAPLGMNLRASDPCLPLSVDLWIIVPPELVNRPSRLRSNIRLYVCIYMWTALL